MSKIFHRRLNLPIETCVHAQGYRVYSQSGRDFIDATGSIGVCAVGYQQPSVIEAVAAQANALSFIHNSLFTTQPAEELAEYLLAHAAPQFSRILFAGGGSEAVETACKLARQYFFERGLPEKQMIISRRLSYHGATLGALSLSGFEFRRKPYYPVLSPNFLADPCYAYRGRQENESEREYGQRALRSIEDKIIAAGPERVCAVLIEPVVGAAGAALMPVSNYLVELRKLCDRYGILLIFDEVMCGLGRTGYLHAGDADSVTPDMRVVAKGLASGYQPLSAVYVSQEITHTFVEQGADFRHGFSFMAHPVACAAALAVQKIINEKKLIENAHCTGEFLLALIREKTKCFPYIGDVRGRGLMIGIEMVADRQTKQLLPKVLQVHERIRKLCYDAGLLVYPQASAPSGEIGDTILLVPPLILDRQGAVEIVDKLTTALGELSIQISRYLFDHAVETDALTYVCATQPGNANDAKAI